MCNYPAKCWKQNGDDGDIRNMAMVLKIKL